MTSNHQQQLDIELYIQKAYACFAQGNIQEAIANFNTAIILYPNCTDIYTERARFRHQKLEDYQGAIEDYTQAININPDNPLLYYWRCQTYLELGNQQEAIEDYNTAMNLAPENTIFHVFPTINNRS